MSQLALSIKDLSKKYKSGPEALKGVNLEIKEGDFFALLGPNGAGKTTTIGIISTLVTKSSGKVEIAGFDLDRYPSEAKKFLGVVPQEINLNFFETPSQICENQAGYYGIGRKKAQGKLEYLLKRLGLWQKRNVQSRLLSGGMKRRLMIARALIHNPKILLLDEPTAGIDVEIRRSMWDFCQELNKNGTTILLTTHYLEEAEHLCNKLAIIDHGRLIKQGEVKELLKGLETETLVLSFEKIFDPKTVLKPFSYKIIDPYSIEVSIDRQHSINKLVQLLSQKGYDLASIQNKTARLESFFMNLVKNNHKV